MNNGSKENFCLKDPESVLDELMIPSFKLTGKFDCQK